MFDALFLLCFLAAVITLTSAAIAAIRGNQVQGLATLRKLGVCAALYMTIVLVVALVLPRKVYSVKDTQCVDDWCIQVVSASRMPGSVVVGLRLSSRARRVPQGEKGTVVYLVDSKGHRYDPMPDSATIPFDTLLQPGESVTTARRFDVSDDVRDLDLVYKHEGGFPIWGFIIGENDWFHGPPVVQLGRIVESAR